MTPCDWCVFTAVDLNGLQVVLGSVYLVPLEGIEPKLEFLGNVVRKLRRDKVLICMDENGQSPTWFFRMSNYRGRLLERFLSRYNLVLLNRPGCLVTYCNMKGQGYSIDLTIGNLGMAPLLRGWTVVTIGDHRAIRILLGVSDRPPRLQERRARAAHGDYASRLASERLAA